MPRDQFDQLLSAERQHFGGGPQENHLHEQIYMAINRYAGQIDISGQDFKALIKFNQRWWVHLKAGSWRMQASMFLRMSR
jgi:hypothetical protein